MSARNGRVSSICRPLRDSPNGSFLSQQETRRPQKKENTVVWMGWPGCSAGKGSVQAFISRKKGVLAAGLNCFLSPASLVSLPIVLAVCRGCPQASYTQCKENSGISEIDAGIRCLSFRTVLMLWCTRR